MGSVKKETSILANNADGMNKQGSAVHVCTRKQSKTLKVQYEFPVVWGHCIQKAKSSCASLLPQVPGVDKKSYLRHSGSSRNGSRHPVVGKNFIL